MDYQDYNDNEILLYISENNEEASNIMFDKYKPLITKMATNLYKYCNNLGLEITDLVQEGLVGLNIAITNFDEKRDNLFYTYAKRCIETKMISAITAAARQKHRLLNESISLSDGDEEDIDLEDRIGDNSYNPEYKLIEQMTEEELINGFKKELTGFEEDVFLLKIAGFNYKEIAEVLDKSNKAVDNALQRIKNKLKSYLNN